MKSHIISIACYCFGFHAHWIIHVLHWSIRDGFPCNLYSWNVSVLCTFLLMDRSKNGEQLWHGKQQMIHSEISMPNSYYNLIILECFLTDPVHWIHNVIVYKCEAWQFRIVVNENTTSFSIPLSRSNRTILIQKTLENERAWESSLGSLETTWK